MAKKLSRFSPKALLLIFIGMTALIYGVISLIVLSQESQATIKQLQKGNGRFELESAKIFMEKYLEVLRSSGRSNRPCIPIPWGYRCRGRQ